MSKTTKAIARDTEKRISSGISGLDDILGGGFPEDRIYLVEGQPGTGKTTLALQFLLDAVHCGQKVIYVTLSETKDELTQAAKTHGWNLDGIMFHELEKGSKGKESAKEYTFFHPADVELTETTERICQEVAQLKPTRVVFDSLSEMRLLAQDPLRYRRQILALKQFFTSRHCTVLLLDDRSSNDPELQLETIAHGVLALENTPTDYGTTARRLRVLKMRGVAFSEGSHDFEIKTGGITVYPRLNAAVERGSGAGSGQTGNVLSGVPELDKMLGGGLAHGSSTLVIGPSGCGKSSFVTQYAWQSAKRKDRVACYLFEEGRKSFVQRALNMGMDLKVHIDRGGMGIEQIDPSKLSPGEFAFRVKEEVEKKKTSVILIDSLNGYINAMPSERFLMIQMYELLTYLTDHGVLTLLVLAQHGLLGNNVQAPVDVSYMADTVVLLRQFESRGSIKKAISVLKKRTSEHDSTIREFEVTSQGVRIGAPLADLDGILTGSPTVKSGNGIKSHAFAG